MSYLIKRNDQIKNINFKGTFGEINKKILWKKCTQHPMKITYFNAQVPLNKSNRLQ